MHPGSSQLAGEPAGRDPEGGNDAGQLHEPVTQPHLKSGDGLTARSEEGNGDRAVVG